MSNSLTRERNALLLADLCLLAMITGLDTGPQLELKGQVECNQGQSHLDVQHSHQTTQSGNNHVPS